MELHAFEAAYMCIYIQMCAHICVYVLIRMCCICAYSMWACQYVCMYECMCFYVWVYERICLWIYATVCVYECVSERESMFGCMKKDGWIWFYTLLWEKTDLLSSNKKHIQIYIGKFLTNSTGWLRPYCRCQGVQRFFQQC